MYCDPREVQRVRANPRQMVRDELSDMLAQLRQNPGDEPEPTSRFDHLTAAERYYIAEVLALD